MSEKVRIDVWLWRARFFKTRSLAARAVEAGAVRVMRGAASRVLAKASELVGPGDLLTIAAGRQVRSLAVAALGERRGPATEARALYTEASSDLDAPQASGHVGSAPEDGAARRSSKDQ